MIDSDNGRHGEPGYEVLARTQRILARAASVPLRLNVERALYFTESMRRTAHLPMSLRWAMAMAHVMEHMTIHILPDELLVGRGNSGGFYGFFYPELEGAYFSSPEEVLFEGEPLFTPEDARIVRSEIAPFWQGKTYRDALFETLTDEQRPLFHNGNDRHMPSFIAYQTASLRHSLQWSLDYRKIIERGFSGIQQEAEQRLTENSANPDRTHFYTGVILLCQAAKDFAERYANHAETLAHTEDNTARAAELLAIAERCRRVPYYPSRTFMEAVQAQWFTQFISRLEQIHGGGAVGNGRIDQYLYPLYARDESSGLLTLDSATEILNLLWTNIAQHQCLQPNPSGLKMYQEHAHWEFTTIGGMTPVGEDATNSLTWIVLRSALQFPLDYPYLGLRVHKNTPEDLLLETCRGLQRGRCIPVLINDEDVIPQLVAKGGTLEEARDYCGSGYSEARMLNRNSYFTGTTWINLASALEMALRDGHCSANSDYTRLGVSTGLCETLTSFEAVMRAFERQLEFLVEQVMAQQRGADAIRADYLAAPLVSALHDLSMKHGKDVSRGSFPGEVSMGGLLGIVGFGSIIDSLAAIRNLVFERNKVTLTELVKALQNNFEGDEKLRQLCQRAPKYGNAIAEVDSIGERIDHFLVTLCEQHTNYYGGTPEVIYIPARGYSAMGRGTGATPDGRRAGEELSYGVAPSPGKYTCGPTAMLMSIQRARGPESRARGSRSAIMELTPQSVAGECGVYALRDLLRCWCTQKQWFLRVRITDNNDWLACINHPKLHGRLLIRSPGFCARPVELAPSMLKEILVGNGNAPPTSVDRPQAVPQELPFNPARQGRLS